MLQNHLASFLILLLKFYDLPVHGFAISSQNVELETIFEKCYDKLRVKI